MHILRICTHRLFSSYGGPRLQAALCIVSSWSLYCLKLRTALWWWWLLLSLTVVSSHLLLYLCYHQIILFQSCIFLLLCGCWLFIYICFMAKLNLFFNLTYGKKEAGTKIHCLLYLVFQTVRAWCYRNILDFSLNFLTYRWYISRPMRT